MLKRPDSLETLQLSHELLRRIPKGRTVTASELHQQLVGDDSGLDLQVGFDWEW